MLNLVRLSIIGLIFSLIISPLGCISKPKGQDASSQRRNPAETKESSVDETAVSRAIDKGVRNLLEGHIENEEGALWRYPARLGLHFSSQYYIMLKWLGITNSRINPDILQKKILDEQMPDGSWYQVKDGTRARGNFDSTIFNYWALKVLLSRPGSHPADSMQKLNLAKDYILSHGGLEKAALFTKVILALFLD